MCQGWQVGEANPLPPWPACQGVSHRAYTRPRIAPPCPSMLTANLEVIKCGNRFHARVPLLPFVAWRVSQLRQCCIGINDAWVCSMSWRHQLWTSRRFRPLYTGPPLIRLAGTFWQMLVRIANAQLAECYILASVNLEDSWPFNNHEDVSRVANGGS